MNRKSGFVKQHLRELRPGTWSTREDVCPWGSQLMEIPDTLVIDNRVITYKQNPDGTQKQSQQDTQTVNASFSDLKRSSHTLTNVALSSVGNPLRRPDLANRWRMRIMWQSLLSTSLFHLVKRSRTFAGLTVDQIRLKSVDSFIESYITDNVLPRYELSNVQLYVKKITNRAGLINPLFNSSVNEKINLTTNFEKRELGRQVELIYSSPFDFRTTNIDYSYNLVFTKV